MNSLPLSLLLGGGVLLLGCWEEGLLENPRIRAFGAVLGWVFLGLAGALWKSAENEFSPRWVGWLWVLPLLVLPVLLGLERFFPPPKTVTDFEFAPEYLLPNAGGDLEIDLMDLVFAGKNPQFRRLFRGKSVEVVGEWRKESGVAKLQRPVMVCCLDDLGVASVLLKTKAAHQTGWVKVRGIVRFRDDGVPCLRVSEIEGIEPLADPYLLPLGK